MFLEKKVEPLNINKELIFSKISDYDVYKMYVSNFKLGESICSPLRQDRHPSWSVFQVEGRLVYKDMSTGESGNCITLVERMFSLNFDKALRKIANDFGIVSDTQDYKKITAAYNKPLMQEKIHAFIQCTCKKYTNRELKHYWGRYVVIGLEKLRKHEVYSLKDVFLNRKKIPIGKDEMVFGYYYNGSWKIMFPEREKNRKWISNIPLDTPVGLSNLNKDHNSLIIKSKKCYMVMEEVYPYLAYMQNEGLGSVTPKTAKYIDENSKTVFYGGDSDAPGKKASYLITNAYKWNHVNTPDILLPNTKDWSDWALEAQSIKPIQNHLIKKGVIT